MISVIGQGSPGFVEEGLILASVPAKPNIYSTSGRNFASPPSGDVSLRLALRYLDLRGGLIKPSTTSAVGLFDGRGVSLQRLQTSVGLDELNVVEGLQARIGQRRGMVP